VPVATLYGWRHRGEGPAAYRIGRHVRYRGRPSRRGLTLKPTGARGNVAHIERRRLQQRDASGRTRTVVHYKVPYRDATGKHHSETKTRLVGAERRKAEIEVARDRNVAILGADFAEWARAWLPTRFDLRPTTWARLESTMQKQVLPYSAPCRATRSPTRSSESGCQLF
jgi:hypothetical protein